MPNDPKLIEAIARAIATQSQEDGTQSPTTYAQAALDAIAAAGYAVVPVEIMKFLYGEGPLENLWFGDSHPAIKGHLWWRHVIQHRLAAAGGGER